MVFLHGKSWKGWCALLSAVCIILALFGGATEVYAAGGSVYGSSASAERGEDVTVSFSISGNPGIWGLKGSVSYDSSVMTLKAVSAGSVFSASEVIMGDTNQNPFSFLATGSTIADKTANGTLVQLTFTVRSDAPYAAHSVGLSISQAINANEQDVSVGASGAKITVAECLHRKTTLKNYVAATEEKEGFSGDAYCDKCGILVKEGSVTPKVVNTCPHPERSKVILKEPTCDEKGEYEFSCNECGKVFIKSTIRAKGHEESAPVDAKAASTTEEGYTGDIYCQVCDALLKEGVVIPKIPIFVFSMDVPTEDTYLRDSQQSLVFVSEASLETFVRVEVDGQVLEEKCYTLESGSTKVTLKPEYLESLADGKHTITIVSDAGTASAQFYVQVVEEEPAGIPNHVLMIITAAALVIAVGCVVFTLIYGASKNKKGRYSNNAEQ